MPPDPVPKAWATLTQAEKLAWLDTQPYPGKRAVSLGVFYRRGASIMTYFHGFYTMLQIPAKEFEAPGWCPTKKLFRRLVHAFNDGVFTLLFAVYKDCLSILVDGSVGRVPPVLDAITSGQLPGFEELLEIPATEDDASWDTTQQIVEILCDQFPNLKKCRPTPGGATYAQLLLNFIDAGTEFFTEYNRFPDVKAPPCLPL
ncbi:hypothetical protein QQX98_000130 [Neonectria punicea]|uniref:Uncharacterized protein n=1 Tax=Neonectria punicea TaxID=979145 RepID=A0ABR1HVE3_9HYPO